jgi:hypothetical protein
VIDERKITSRVDLGKLIVWYSRHQNDGMNYRQRRPTDRSK